MSEGLLNESVHGRVGVSMTNLIARSKVRAEQASNTSEEGEVGTRSVDGPLRQIQAKREKAITAEDLTEFSIT